MFVEVNSTDKQGKSITKHVNLLNASIIHDINPDDPDNKGKFNSVIYMQNGYAAYSMCSAAQLVQSVQGNVVHEQAIIQQGATNEQSQ